MKIKSLNELYIDELRDLFSAETQITKALPKMADGADSPKLKKAIETHLEQTKGQLERLTKIFEDLGEDSGGEFCQATEGLLKEGGQALKDIDKGAVRDAAIISSAQRVEHYEISAYGTARTFADILGYGKHSSLLQQTLDEESATDLALTELALGEINEAAKSA